jgi:hypothetical protein
MWHIIALPIFLALFGYIFTTHKWVLFTNSLTPAEGLLVYYSVVFAILFILQYFGLIIADIEFNSTRHLIGSVLIWFSFFILFDFSSCWTNYVNKGDCKSVPKVFLQTEDGATYSFWNQFVEDPEKIRLLTYVFTPFILTLIAMFLIEKKVALSIFS